MALTSTEPSAVALSDPPSLAARHTALIIAAATAGTAFEWYDFFIYGAIAGTLAKNFFANVDPALAYLFSLLAFSAGFAVRPFGSLLFGQLGDLWGRKNTFLVTMLLMGGATISVGLLPTYRTIGLAAPVLLVAARLVQGFSVGGEFGGAVVYLAEHAPARRRGFITSFIQITPTAGLSLALATVLSIRTLAGEQAFAAWAWRAPFLLSGILLGVSIWIRLKLGESPVFDDMKKKGEGSANPLKDLFSTPRYLGLAALAFAMSAAMTVVFYAGEFYAEFFMERVLHVAAGLANGLMIIVLLAAAPLVILVGWLSDLIGRKWLFVAGCLSAALLLFPLFQGLARAANPALMEASDRAPVTVFAPAGACTGQFDLLGRAARRSSCDVARLTLADVGVSYRNRTLVGSGPETVVQIGPLRIRAPRGGAAASSALETAIRAGLARAGYPRQADPSALKSLGVLGALFAVLICVVLTIAPLGAMLADLFPPSVRYSGVSFPYNIAAGWFGGFLPPIAFTLVTATGDMFAGLLYPVAVTGVLGLCTAIFYREPRR